MISNFFLIPLLSYFPMIFMLKNYLDQQKLIVRLKIRKNKLLQNILTYWNLGLAVFSLYGSVSCVIQLVFRGYNCSFMQDKLWIDLFYYSKVIELLDTFFIILLGKELQLIHMWHHFATLFLCAMGKEIYPQEVILAAGMNYSVHTIMYSYYYISALGYKWIHSYGYIITFFQTLQMIVAIYSLMFNSVISCIDPNISTRHIYMFSFFMYCTYIYFFGKIFFEKLLF